MTALTPAVYRSNVRRCELRLPAWRHPIPAKELYIRSAISDILWRDTQPCGVLGCVWRIVDEMEPVEVLFVREYGVSTEHLDGSDVLDGLAAQGTRVGWLGSGRCMEHDAVASDGIIGDPLLVRGGDAVNADALADIDILFRNHRVRLTRLATAITLDQSLAEEVVQEAFTGLHRRLSAVSNPEGYLQRSVVNLSIKVLRRRSVASRYRPDPPPLTHIPEVDETWRAVMRLPPRQRAVVALRYWDDLSEEQIAHSLSWPPGTVKSTLHRALRRLKEELTP